jgi:uncharacterized protein YoxC
MFETTGDILNIVIAVSVAFVAFFLSFLLFYLIMVVRDVNFVTTKVKYVTELVDSYVKTPAKAVVIITEKLKMLTSAFEKHNKKKSSKK